MKTKLTEQQLKTGTANKKELAGKNSHGISDMEDKKMMKKPLPFGAFLLGKNLITERDLMDALDFQAKSKVPVGKIAMLNGNLSQVQVLEILDTQLGFYPLHFRFGEIGLQRGYLDQGNLNDILERQKILRLYLGEALLKLRKMEYETAERALSEYEQLISPDKLPVMSIRIF